MDGSAGMLLFPEGNERRLDPMAQRAEPVDAGMAGGAQSNQEARLMDPGSAVMDRQFTGQTHSRGSGGRRAPKPRSRCPAKRRREWLFLPVAAGAQSATKEACLPAGAEKPGLPTAQRSDARW